MASLAFSAPERRFFRHLSGSRLIIVASAAGFVLFLLWATFTKVDEVTHGQGRVIPSSKVLIDQKSGNNLLYLLASLLLALLVVQANALSKGGQYPQALRAINTALAICGAKCVGLTNPMLCTPRSINAPSSVSCFFSAYL